MAGTRTYAFVYIDILLYFRNINLLFLVFFIYFRCIYDTFSLPISKSEQLSWHELTIFCYFSAAWTLTNAVQAANLIANYRISLAELQAIRLVFMQYDRNLHGCILAVDIQRVLKDMHCEYDSEEMSLILKGAVALDGQGKVELGDFLRWWCSTSE